jgi:hypothetical protein
MPRKCIYNLLEEEYKIPYQIYLATSRNYKYSSLCRNGIHNCLENSCRSVKKYIHCSIENTCRYIF